MLHMFAMRVCLARNTELFRLDLALCKWKKLSCERESKAEISYQSKAYCRCSSAMILEAIKLARFSCWNASRAMMLWCVEEEESGRRVGESRRVVDYSGPGRNDNIAHMHLRPLRFGILCISPRGFLSSTCALSVCCLLRSSPGDSALVIIFRFHGRTRDQDVIKQ